MLLIKKQKNPKTTTQEPWRNMNCNQYQQDTDWQWAKNH